VLFGQSPANINCDKKMLNYLSIINILKSDRYVDKTANFERFLYYSETLCNCANTGASLFLKTFACFLDKNANSKEVFKNLKIAQSEKFEKFVNNYNVLFLDFSDFNAKTYDEAIEYMRNKMSDIYKEYCDIFADHNAQYYSYDSLESALNIIEKTSDIKDLQESLHWLLSKLHGYETYDPDNYLAILVDNMILLETVARQYGYLSEMREFLEKFIEEDIYKWCDIFLQMGFYTDIDDKYCTNSDMVVYRNFCVGSDNLQRRFEDIAVSKNEQYPFHYEPLKPQEKDWTAYIAGGRKTVAREKHEKELANRRYIRAEKKKYAVDLSPEVPRFSPNMGIRAKQLDKSSKKYERLNNLVKAIYKKFSPKFDYYDIYKYFQKIDTKKRIINDTETFEKQLESLCKGNSTWKNPHANGSFGYWVQISYTRADDEDGFSAGKPNNIKAYACFKTTAIKDIFVDSIKYLLQNAHDNFAAKIATCQRSDQMCYWLSKDDFKLLESFYKPYAKDMKKTLPFVAYKGMLGVSKDFPDVNSHNATQASIIADYLKGVNNEESIDLEDMYNNYISKWNGDIYNKNNNGFLRDSALSFIMILDTLDAILGKTRITDNSFMLSGEAKPWNVLAKSRCWFEVNERWG